MLLQLCISSYLYIKNEERYLLSRKRLNLPKIDMKRYCRSNSFMPKMQMQNLTNICGIQNHREICSLNIFYVLGNEHESRNSGLRRINYCTSRSVKIATISQNLLFFISKNFIISVLYINKFHQILNQNNIEIKSLTQFIFHLFFEIK